LNASAENETAVLAHAEASCPAVINAAATIAPLKTLRDNIIVSSVFDVPNADQSSMTAFGAHPCYGSGVTNVTSPRQR
jgi:hypothetical protein